MDLRQLTIFREVAKTLSFTRAAASLGYVQSNITAQIHGLEAELGVPLFDRLGKQVVLTEAGQQLLYYAQRLLSLAEEAQTSVSTGQAPQGTLKIAASETLCIYRLPRLLRAFRERYPRVHLIFCPSPTAALRRLVHAGNVDVAFVLDDQDIVGDPGDEILLSEEVWLLSAPDYPLATKTEVAPTDMMMADLLLTEQGCAYRQRFDRLLSRYNVYPTSLLEFSSLEAVKQCVITGLGVTVLPAVAVSSEVACGQLCRLPWAGPDLTMAMHLVWHKDKWISPALEAFLDLARAQFLTTPLTENW